MASRAGDDMDDIRKVLFKEKPQYVIGTACSQKMDVVAAKAGIRFEHDVEVSLASLEKGGHLCFCHCALTWFYLGCKLEETRGADKLLCANLGAREKARKRCFGSSV
ncbi:unnamed protein product [Ixodes persulcatus]